MVREAMGIAVTVWVLGGCALTVPPPTTTEPVLSRAQECMRGGGWWRESLGLCEVQGTSPDAGRH